MTTWLIWCSRGQLAVGVRTRRHADMETRLHAVTQSRARTRTPRDLGDTQTGLGD